MDWNAAIERNGQALRRVLAMLVALAGLGVRDAAAKDGVGRPTLPRHRHRAVLRLLRPVEAAARRLIIVAARGLVVTPSPARPHKPRPKPVAPLLRSLGIAVVMPSADWSRLPAGQAAPKTRLTRTHLLPLLDPIRQPRTSRARHVAAHAGPRICVPGATARHRLPSPPSPKDMLDATRLGLRLQALACVLDDLPKHARRLARWRARRDRRSADGRPRRLSPLKPGRPPGFKHPPTRDVDEILADLHHFAHEALEHRTEKSNPVFGSLRCSDKEMDRTRASVRMHGDPTPPDTS